MADQEHSEVDFASMSDADYLAGNWGDLAPTVEEPANGIEQTVTTETQTNEQPEEVVEDHPDTEDNPEFADNLDEEPDVNDNPEGTINLADYSDDQLVQALEVFNSLIDTPIKAAGAEIKFSSHDEIIKGLQKGADYTRKTAEIKPFRTTLAALGDAGLLGNEQELNIMIDAFKGNKEAIAYMVKKHEVDLEQVDESYTPSQNFKTEKALDLQETLDELKTSNSLDAVTKVTNSWDEGSLDIIYKNPSLLYNLSEDLTSGDYNKAMATIAKQKLIGTYDTGKTDIENYASVIMAIQAKPAAVPPPKPKAKPKAKPRTASLGGTPRGTTRKRTGGLPTSEELEQAAQEMASMSDQKWLELYG